MINFAESTATARHGGLPPAERAEGDINLYFSDQTPYERKSSVF